MVKKMEFANSCFTSDLAAFSRAKRKYNSFAALFCGERSRFMTGVAKTLYPPQLLAR